MESPVTYKVTLVAHNPPPPPKDFALPQQRDPPDLVHEKQQRQRQRQRQQYQQQREPNNNDNDITPLSSPSPPSTHTSHNINVDNSNAFEVLPPHSFYTNKDDNKNSIVTTNTINTNAAIDTITTTDTPTTIIETTTSIDINYHRNEHVFNALPPISTNNALHTKDTVEALPPTSNNNKVNTVNEIKSNPTSLSRASLTPKKGKAKTVEALPPTSKNNDNNNDKVEAKPPISDDITNITPLLPISHKLKFFITTTFPLAMPPVHLFPSESITVSLWILKFYFMTRIRIGTTITAPMMMGVVPMTSELILTRDNTVTRAIDSTCSSWIVLFQFIYFFIILCDMQSFTFVFCFLPLCFLPIFRLHAGFTSRFLLLNTSFYCVFIMGVVLCTLCVAYTIGSQYT